jgi:hypothetical protein
MSPNNTPIIVGVSDLGSSFQQAWPSASLVKTQLFGHLAMILRKAEVTETFVKSLPIMRIPGSFVVGTVYLTTYILSDPGRDNQCNSR